MKTFGKIIKKILIGIVVLVVALFAVVLFLWHNEISAYRSIKQIAAPNKGHLDGAIYEMTVPGGYDFDKFLKEGGASSGMELNDFITHSITKGLMPTDVKEGSAGCSSFTAYTDDGHKLFGRNYDYSRTNVCILHTKPGKGRHASVSTVDLQFLEIGKDADVEDPMNKILMLAAPYVPIDGMNDAGVACGIYMSYQGSGDVPTDQCTDLPDITATTMLRLILDYADSVDEAVELVKQYDLHDTASFSFHYMVADASGKSAVLEWINGTDSTDNDGTKRELHVIEQDDKGFQTVTNYILSEGYYDGEPESEMKGLDRNQYLQETLGATNGQVADTEAAMDVLKGVGRRLWSNNSGDITVHSVVYDLTDCSALWVGNEHYGEEAYTLHLSVGD